MISLDSLTDLKRSILFKLFHNIPEFWSSKRLMSSEAHFALFLSWPLFLFSRMRVDQDSRQSWCRNTNPLLGSTKTHSSSSWRWVLSCASIAVIIYNNMIKSVSNVEASGKTWQTFVHCNIWDTEVYTLYLGGLNRGHSWSFVA